jgi:hypothetical protein
MSYETTPPTTGATTTPIQQFINMSVVLTGFAASVVAPLFAQMQAQTNVAQQIFDAATADDETGFTALLTQFAVLKAKGIADDEIVKLLMDPDSSEAPNVARSVVLAWYTGAWYASASLDANNMPPARILSSSAYERGLMWRAVQAHAMGSADYPFGYWHDDPPSLQQFVTN